MTSNTLIEVTNISKTYGQTIALGNSNLTVGEGELIALAGPSGSGKTTLLNLLSGWTKPTTGSVSIRGQDLKYLIPGKNLSELVGLIDQQYSIVPQLSVINNVLAGKLGQWGFFKSLFSLIHPLYREKVQSTLDGLGIGDKIDNKASHLSGGEQQRVAIARIIMQSPSVILADEPIASLDPARAKDIMDIIKNQLISKKQSLIISLHNTELIKHYCTRLIGLKGGNIVLDIQQPLITENTIKELYI
ncbi:MAG TPA: ABC transporter ATP-binding protein [Dehalococcoidia bacterium]|jgi:phosphonate transport system ATP-binding protein|nr:ABC transporter ATP-binding protein [Dehalococcoidia bacterium]